MILTADHGCDPSWSGTDHTREQVPVLVFGPDLKPGSGGTLPTFADIGETIAAHLKIDQGAHGKSFLHRKAKPKLTTNKPTKTTATKYIKPISHAKLTAKKSPKPADAIGVAEKIATKPAVKKPTKPSAKKPIKSSTKKPAKIVTVSHAKLTAKKSPKPTDAKRAKPAIKKRVKSVKKK